LSDTGLETGPLKWRNCPDFDTRTRAMNAPNQKTQKSDATATTRSKGQRRSQERGSATRSKKYPGKRPSQGGS
jgi:hypothetical protein